MLPHIAMCPTALNLASLSRRDPVLPRISQLQTSPPYQGGLRCCHVSYSFGPRLPIEEGSGAAMCPIALDRASLLRRASVLPHIS
jgi:hypothetical protein